jgi:hypothetical protein
MTEAMPAGWPRCCGWGFCRPGYIYPEAQRPLRDLLRQRSFLVRQCTSQLLHTGNIVSRNPGPIGEGRLEGRLGGRPIGADWGPIGADWGRRLGSALKK